MGRTLIFRYCHGYISYASAEKYKYHCIIIVNLFSEKVVGLTLQKLSRCRLICDPYFMVFRLNAYSSKAIK